MVDSRTRVGNTQVSLEHLVMPESKEVLKTHTDIHNNGVIAKAYKSQLQKLPMANLSNKIN